MERLAARAKINLFLDVHEKRPDGYHEVSTIMQNITLADLIELSPSDSGPQVIYSDCPACDFHDDIIIKAWQVLREETGLEMNFAANVRKVIPVAAGLGGGSADAAAALVGLNNIFSIGLTPTDLESIGARIGADVPFFIRGGAAIGTGAGEILAPAVSMPDCDIVIIKPAIDVSTVRAYQDYDDFFEVASDNGPDRDINQMAKALASGDYKAVCGALYNSFEPVMFAKHPEISAVKEAAQNDGADAALMSGSGSTVFALTRDPETAGRIANNAVRNGAISHIVKPCNKAIVGLD